MAELKTRKGISREKRKRVLATNNGRCVYCDSIATATDHVIPNYDNDYRNLVPTCQSCNSAKGHRSVEDYCLSQMAKGLFGPRTGLAGNGKYLWICVRLGEGLTGKQINFLKNPKLSPDAEELIHRINDILKSYGP